jgi:hypothetical protein
MTMLILKSVTKYQVICGLQLQTEWIREADDEVTFKSNNTNWSVSWIDAIMCRVGVPLFLWFTSVPSLLSRPVVYMWVGDSVNSQMFLCRNNPGLSLTYNSEPHRVKLSPWDRVLEMLKVTRLAKIFPGFYRIRRFIIVFTRAHPWYQMIQVTSSHQSYWNSILILYSHLRWSLPSILSLLCILT